MTCLLDKCILLRLLYGTGKCQDIQVAQVVRHHDSFTGRGAHDGQVHPQHRHQQEIRISGRKGIRHLVGLGESDLERKA